MDRLLVSGYRGCGWGPQPYPPRVLPSWLLTNDTVVPRIRLMVIDDDRQTLAALDAITDSRSGDMTPFQMRAACC
jgi:hypothetical protein